MTQETVHVLDPCCGSRMMWFDTLYEQAALMDAVTDEAARLRLNEVFDAKQAELEAA